jgi:hypothetical protein
VLVLCVLFFLGHSSLQYRKATQSIKIEHIGLQSFQDPEESQADRKVTSASLWLPTTYCWPENPSDIPARGAHHWDFGGKSLLWFEEANGARILGSTWCKGLCYNSMDCTNYEWTYKWGSLKVENFKSSSNLWRTRGSWMLIWMVHSRSRIFICVMVYCKPNAYVFPQVLTVKFMNKAQHRYIFYSVRFSTQDITL